MLEHDLQNEIRIAISHNKIGTSFRTNVGQAWTGERIEHNSDGSITIHKPRPFKSGLPEGFSDLLVVIPTTVTQDMVGQFAAIAGFIEVKTGKRKTTKPQDNFIAAMKGLGARAGVARSVDDAIEILGS